ncbi:amino acid ABC transporter permease [Euzebya sp.]|uniref:amino acid ABC transporter permease n=1 Tax=Euzebya sp. TaxID=1971409 RepID=UPI003517CC2B
MTDTTDARDAVPAATPPTTGRTTPEAGDTAPTAALVLGLLALVAAPVVLWVVDVGIAGLAVPVVGYAANALARSYAARIDYSPPGDGVMRRAQTGRLAGIAGALVFALGGLVTWVVGNDQLASLGTLLFNPEFFTEAFPTLLAEGLRITLIVWVVAVVLGQVLGVVLALMSISRRFLIRALASVYIDIFRGLPAIITIVLVGFALPLAGLRPFGRNQIWYAAFALGLVATAYIGEIVRAGIQSIEGGQMEAARSLGMPHQLAMRLIVIPQGIRRVVPPLTNEYIALLKDTSLIFIIGLPASSGSFFQGRDLFRVGQNLAQQYGNYSPVVLAGIFYLVLTIPLTRLTNYLDRRLREGRSAEERSVAADDDVVDVGATHGHGGAIGGGA